MILDENFKRKLLWYNKTLSLNINNLSNIKMNEETFKLYIGNMVL